MDRNPGLRLLTLSPAMALLAREGSTIPGSIRSAAIGSNRPMGIGFAEGPRTVHADEAFSTEGRVHIPDAGGQAIVQTELYAGTLKREGNRLHLTSNEGEMIEVTFDRASPMSDGGLVQMIQRS